MVKLLLSAVAIAVLGYFGYQAILAHKANTLEDQVAHAPKRQLDNVREKAKKFEADDQKRADDMTAKSAE